MQSIRQIQRLNDIELQKCTPPNASWHTDYRDTAYIHIGGLPFELSEGDVMTICSQYGNPTHVNLIRDKETGKSRGFGFLKFEDQRSADLAVDNLSGASVLGRTLSVDHARYKMKEGEVETVGDEEEEGGDETDRESEGQRKRRRRSGSESGEERPRVKEEAELAKLMQDHDADDPMKAYLIEQKKAEVEEALKAVAISKKSSKGEDGERRHKHRHRHRHRSRRDGSEDDDRRDGHRSRRERDDEGERKSRSHRHSRRERSASPRDSDLENDRSKQTSRRKDEGPEDNDDDRRRRDHRSSRHRDDS